MGGMFSSDSGNKGKRKLSSNSSGVDYSIAPVIPKVTPSKSLILVSSRWGSMYLDEDGDLANEFYEEVPARASRKRGPRLIRVTKNLKPQRGVHIMKQSLSPLLDYEMTEQFGFLLADPLEKLPLYFNRWNVVASSVADTIQNGSLRDVVHQMPLLDFKMLSGIKEKRLAHLQLGTIAAAYVWCEGDTNIPKVLPSNIAVPLFNLSEDLGLKAISGHSSVCLANYRVKNNHQFHSADDLEMLYAKFVDAFDNDWFFLITCDIEYQFAKCLPFLYQCFELMNFELKNVSFVFPSDAVDKLVDCLVGFQDAVESMSLSFCRIREKCQPCVFFNSFRPYLAGYSGKAFAETRGIIFEGVSQQPISLAGGSAAQSSTLQVIDMFLGITHSDDCQTFLNEMRQYMPPKHKLFIEDVGRLSRLRQIVLFGHQSHQYDSMQLVAQYNSLVNSVANLRSKHIQIVTQYIVQAAIKQAENDFKSLNTEGTGGSGILPFLKKVRDTTLSAVIM